MKITTKCIVPMFLAVCLMFSMSVTALAASFTDVPESHWSYAAVEKAATNGLVNGTGNSQYTPEKSVSNAEWCQMLANLFMEPGMYSSPNVAWWYNAVRFCHEMSYLENTTFRSKYNTQNTNYMYADADANTAINRYDMAQIIYNIAIQDDMFTLTVNTAGISYKIGDYHSVPSKYRTAVEYCYAAGFISGVDQQGTFNGTSIMDRAQAATVLCRLFDAKNGDWTVPNFTDPNEPVATLMNVKDMLTVTPNGAAGTVKVTNTYTAGKLSNGKAITEANITAMLDEIKAIVPNGMAWGDHTKGQTAYIYDSAVTGKTSGCNSFAGMVGDVIFGVGANWTSTTDFTNVKVGDLIKYVDAKGVALHWVVVIGVTTEQTTLLVNGKPTPGPVDTVLTTCDGNNNSQVRWNGTRYVNSDLLVGAPKSVIYTAY